jgi:hypothetical protein
MSGLSNELAYHSLSKSRVTEKDNRHNLKEADLLATTEEQNVEYGAQTMATNFCADAGCRRGQIKQATSSTNGRAGYVSPLKVAQFS